MTDVTDRELARYIQHTLIRTGTTADEITKHCLEAVGHGFDGVMVPAAWVLTARDIVAGTGVKLASAVDFPFGSMTTVGKVAEACALVEAGVDQLDIGVRTGHLRSGLEDDFREDIAAVVRAVDVPVKVMLELPLLSPAQRVRAVELAVSAGVSWLKNASSGAIGTATPDDIAFLRAHAPSQVHVKASGGINSAQQVRDLIAAGAELVGTSNGLAIIGAGADVPDRY